LISCS